MPINIIAKVKLPPSFLKLPSHGAGKQSTSGLSRVVETWAAQVESGGTTRNIELLQKTLK